MYGKIQQQQTQALTYLEVGVVVEESDNRALRGISSTLRELAKGSLRSSRLEFV